ncbi:MAG: Asp-tRNA(Asn)/Glu-tRNA(Gln) amidotransferase subunit GatC [bacterium]
MVNFDREELLKIAKLSALELNEQEIELFEKQIGQILNFVQELQEVKLTTQAQSTKNINILREDVAIQKNSDDILTLAPETNNNYFVVPKILD